MRVLIGYRPNDHEEIVWPIEEDGNLYSGRDGLEWSIDSPNHPLDARLRLDTKAQMISFTYAFHAERWNTVEYRRLPYAWALLDLFSGVVSSGKTAIAFRHEGEIKSLGEMPMGIHLDALRPLVRWLKSIDAVKTVCKWADVGVQYDGLRGLTGKQASDWMRAAALVQGKTVEGTPGEVAVPDAEPFRTLLDQKGKLILRSSIRERNAIVLSSNDESTAWMRLDREPERQPSVDAFAN
jgi:hypothetical protein